MSKRDNMIFLAACVALGAVILMVCYYFAPEAGRRTRQAGPTTRPGAAAPETSRPPSGR